MDAAATPRPLWDRLQDVGLAVMWLGMGLGLAYFAYSGDIHAPTGRRGRLAQVVLSGVVNTIGVMPSVALFAGLGALLAARSLYKATLPTSEDD